MKKDKDPFKILDYVLILLVSALIVSAGYTIYAHKTGKLQLVVEAPTGSWIYSISEGRTVEIPGLLGNTILLIENGSVKVTDSPCLNKTCIASPPLRHQGDWNACLPNQVLIRLDGEAESEEVDVIAR